MIAAWVLSLMVILQPAAPWRDTYPATAEAIGRVATESPLYEGEDAPVRTAALLVSLAWHESRFNVGARDQTGGHAIGLYQIEPSNIPKDLRALVLRDPLVATRQARILIAMSFRICKGKEKPPLAWYAKGGNGCDVRGRKESDARLWLARRLIRDYPPDVF
jgi:hypothetical protein